jgi:hypothetical protein
LKKISAEKYRLTDHGGGFDINLRNCYLDSVAELPATIITEYRLENLEQYYPLLNFVFDVEFKQKLFKVFHHYNQHPEINFHNFLCSFNGADHVGRKLLVAILNKFGLFDPNYCSKNIVFSVDTLNGHIVDFAGSAERFWSKFFIGANSEDFFQTIHSFGYVRFNHSQNIKNLESKLTQSFLHIVSETMATSYYPFVTEKFLYSVVTRGLFLAYAQPGWHHHVEKYYGFKRYTRLFDYRFDFITNPVERLVELISMISRFSVLSVDDWRDLYLLEQDTIEYNYDHYFSNRYLKCLEHFV